MKVRNSKLFPYPVLSKTNDSYINNGFDVDTILSFDSEVATFDFKYIIPDSIILSLLKSEIINLYCQVDCSETKFRKMYKINLDNEFKAKISIELSRICGEIEIISLLISNEKITNYKNDNIDQFYLESGVIIPQYSIIGYTETDVFYLNKRTNSNGELPSLFAITGDEKSDKMSYDCESNNDLITIFLPMNEYEIYTDFKGKRKRLKQLMINFPVLVDILDQIKNDNNEVLASKPWYNALESILVNKGFTSGFEDENFKNGNSIEIAQKLLGPLIQDAFKEFDEIIDD